MNTITTSKFYLNDVNAFIHDSTPLDYKINACMSNKLLVELKRNMEEQIYYEAMSLGAYQEPVAVSGVNNAMSYSMNESYLLQTNQHTEITAVAADASHGSRSVGGVEVEHSDNTVTRDYVKRCSVALTTVVVLLALATFAALALAVIDYSHLTGELTDKVNLLSIERNEINSLHSQLIQVRNETQEIEEKLTNLLRISVLQPNCGAGLWNRVAFLNMSDPSEQCPSTWRLVTTGGVRACGRLNSSAPSCEGLFYSSISEYQRVCGRVIGYQFSHPDGFGFRPPDLSILNNTKPYVDGLSITYGQPRHHIWTYAAGLSENSTYLTAANCPCSPETGQRPPRYVGNNYYCESGNQNTNEDSFLLSLYTDDKLWDGEQCEGTCCSGSRGPPWFSVSLPNPTTESIEVRICGDQSTVDEDTPIELLEIFVQ